jgi:hypothetical protein
VVGFVSGVEFNGAFYAEVIGPLVVPWPHAAARLGTGSDVLGFDDQRSTDHGWGPQLVLLVAESHLGDVRAAIEEGLPDTFGGWPVRYGRDDTPLIHHVSVSTPAAWLSSHLGVDPIPGLAATDWLLVPQQKLLEVTGGAVYHDDDGTLSRVRSQLSWFPEPVWLWILACQWRRIAQEEAFIGRTAEVGDEVGSRLAAARMVRELVRLWFLFNRAYWPYTKWFGSAFARLPGAEVLDRAVRDVLAAGDYRAREAALTEAYELVGRRHNETALTDSVDPTVRSFYGRGYQVLMSDRFVGACLSSLVDQELKSLPLVGSVDQVADSTDLLSDGTRPRRLAALYRN